MSIDPLCFVAFVVLAVVSVVLFVLAKGTNLSRGTAYSSAWAQFRDAWREARTPGERGIVLALLIGHLMKKGVWGAAVAFVAALSTAFVALCSGVDWVPLIREVRESLLSLYKELRGSPSPTTRPTS